MINEAGSWLIVGLPLASFLIIGLVIRPFFNRYADWAGYLTIASIAGSLGLSIWAFASVADAGGNLVFEAHEWLSFPDLMLPFGILMDSLTVVMLLTVTGVSLLVQIYSLGYMKGDPGYARYFAYMSLFTASMLGLVVSRGVVQIYVFWELVGLSSYLLIGFWYMRPAAAAAAKKAFLMTRFGDFAFLLAILYLFTLGDNLLDLPHLYEAVHLGMIGGAAATWIALGIFAGAVGKSAQFPLHTWLPDAMEGPSPVSALVHSATMVAAGVFLVGRFFPLFELTSPVMNTVALVGGFTALFAASMALVATDIKRVFAFSTISQLGYMFLALGTGAYVAAFFHLFVHAWFKTLLFMSAGSAHHASGTFDMRYMGGLRKVMPWTYAATVIGGLSLVGIFPFAGCWSKDEILLGALDADSTVGVIVLVLGLTAVVMTGFYMFRVIFMVYHGKFRGGIDKENEDLRAAGQEIDEAHAHGRVHLAESPWLMVLPISILALAALVSGFLTNPVESYGIVDKHSFGEFVTENVAVFPYGSGESLEHPSVLAEEAGAGPDFNFPLAIASSALALSGIALAFAMYQAKVISPSRMAARFRPVYKLLINKYYMDELYETIIVRKLFYERFARFTASFDRSWVDGVNVQVASWSQRFGTVLSFIQDGQLQTYGAVASAGVVIALAVFLFWV